MGEMPTAKRMLYILIFGTISALGSWITYLTIQPTILPPGKIFELPWYVPITTQKESGTIQFYADNPTETIVIVNNQRVNLTEIVSVPHESTILLNYLPEGTSVTAIFTGATGSYFWLQEYLWTKSLAAVGALYFLILFFVVLLSSYPKITGNALSAYTFWACLGLVLTYAAGSLLLSPSSSTYKKEHFDGPISILPKGIVMINQPTIMPIWADGSFIVDLIPLAPNIEPTPDETVPNQYAAMGDFPIGTFTNTSDIRLFIQPPTDNPNLVVTVVSSSIDPNTQGLAILGILMLVGFGFGLWMAKDQIFA